LKKSYQFHVIPNTHWDREWLYNFQETRMFLIEFMDKLLDIFEKYPQYKTYLLDSQTIPIEDYLEIRPEKAEEIRKRVQEKRLFIGPWYTLPEEFLVNGESLVRNLLFGHKIAEKFGGVMKVGYSPFSYGQTSQMPQIYRGFGIDTILFYHGITSEESRSEFIFEGADGSRLFASRMGSNARYNFFFAIYRPLVFGKKLLERDYHWEEGGLPFHLCEKRNYQQHYYLLDPIKHFFKEQLPDLFEQFIEAEKEHATTSNIACMLGMDSTQPDEFELKTIEESTKVLKQGKIFHSSLPDWIEATRWAAAEDELVVLKGERRTPRLLGTRVHLYGDVTSARTRLKRKNAQAELELQRKAEPFAALANVTGIEYPTKLLEKSWRYLLQCHPHDSIAGTGIDQIETDMSYRLDQSANIAVGVKRRALQAIQKQINNSDVEPGHVLLTIFNASPYPRTEVISAILDLPGFKQYGLWDAVSYEPVEFQEVCRYDYTPVVRHLGDATMQMKVLRIHLHLLVKKVPALGYSTIIIKPADDVLRSDTSLMVAPNIMENEYLRIAIKANGTIDILHKQSDHLFQGLHYFEDGGEAGHAWRHIPPAKDRILTTIHSSPQIEQLEAGPLIASFLITHTLKIPARLNEGSGDYVSRLDAEGDAAMRSEEVNDLIIKSELILRKGSQGLEVKTTFNNNCADHRLRVMFPTNLLATHSCAEVPFDVVERPIERGAESRWRNTWNPTHPHQRFVDVSDGVRGLAVVNDGLREYEVSEDQTRTIGLTLLRAFEVALTTVAWRWERHPEMKLSQAPGEHEFRYLIYPHVGNWDEGNVFQQAELFNVPLELAQAGPHEGHLPKANSFLDLKPDNLIMSTLKKAEKSDSLIWRVFNPTIRDIEAKIKLTFPAKRVRLLNLNEEPIEKESFKIAKDEINLLMKKKKIYTIELK